MDIKFSTISNKPVITGGSGINPEDYLKWKLGKENKQIKTLENDLVRLDNTTLAFTNYAAKLNDLKVASNALRGTQKFSEDYQYNVFAKNKVDIFSSNQAFSPGSNFVSIDSEDVVTPGTYKIRIVNLATVKTNIYAGFSSATTDVVTSAPGFFSAGDFTINGQTVSLVGGDTLNSINTKINALNAVPSVSSKVIKRTSSEYALVISAQQPGVINGFTINDSNNVLSQLNPTINAALDASLYFNDILIERSTNIIDDFDDAITLKATLLAPSGSLDITIKSSPDTDAVVSAISSFTNAFNEIQRFIYLQSERDPKTGKFKENAILGQESEFVASNSKLLELVMQKVESVAPLNFDTLEDIGIVLKSYKGSTAPGDTPANNALQFIDNTGQTVINFVKNSIDGVRKLFAFDYVSSSTNLIITRTTNKIITTSFTIDADLSRPMVAVPGGMAQDKVRIIVDGQTYRPNFKDGEIIAPEGSPIDGMNLYYGGTGPETITVTLSQGIADKFYNYLSWFVANDYYTGSNSKVDDLLNGLRQYDSDGNVIKKQQQIYGGINLIKDKINMESDLTKQTLKSIEERTGIKRESELRNLAKNEARIKKSQDMQKNLEDQFMAQYGKK